MPKVAEKALKYSKDSPKRNLTPPPVLIGTFLFAFISNSIRNQSHWSLINNLINDPELLRLFGGHEVIPIHILLNNIDRLARVLGVQFIQRVPNPNNLLGMNRDILRLAAVSTRRLVNHDGCIWKRTPLTLVTSTQ